MPSQSHTVLLAKFAAVMLLIGLVMPVLAQFRGAIAFRRLSLLECLLLAILVMAGTLGFFKWIANKHFREY
jgi:hypothetical protein